MSPLPKPCIIPDCPNLTLQGSKCAIHEREYQHERNKRPGRALYRDPTYRAIPRVGQCEVCGTTEDITIDHIIAITNGGTNDPSNLRYLCRKHNSSKHNKETETQ